MCSSSARTSTTLQQCLAVIVVQSERSRVSVGQSESQSTEAGARAALHNTRAVQPSTTSLAAQSCIVLTSVRAEDADADADSDAEASGQHARPFRAFGPYVGLRACRQVSNYRRN